MAASPQLAWSVDVRLGRIAASARFVPFRIEEKIDAERRYRLEFEPAFPFVMNCFEFARGPAPVPMTWHERFELFCPVTGTGAFRMGQQLVEFLAGDILLVDNLVLHGVENYEGPLRRAMVLSFPPEFLGGPGSLPCDAFLLRPFLQRRANRTLKLTASHPAADRAWSIVESIAAAGDESLEAQARTKHAVADLLLLLENAWREDLTADSDYEDRRKRLRRLNPLLEYLRSHFHEKITVRDAASRVRMSESYFMRFFRNATGLTFLAYLEQLRVMRAWELLIETDLPLSQIAAETGFCDQSHLSRHFQERYGTSPGRARRAQTATNSAALSTAIRESRCTNHGEI